MPGLTIHLAAAKEYIRKHPNEDEAEFLDGAIAPDFAADGFLAHRSSPDVTKNGQLFLSGKVILKDSLNDFDINTSFGRGYFFHLITDHEFCQQLLKYENNYSEMTYEGIREKLYHDYSVTNAFFKKKYGVVFPEKIKEYGIEKPGTPIIINTEDICKMIDMLSEIDLKDYYDAQAQS